MHFNMFFFVVVEVLFEIKSVFIFILDKFAWYIIGFHIVLNAHECLHKINSITINSFLNSCLLLNFAHIRFSVLPDDYLIDF